MPAALLHSLCSARLRSRPRAQREVSGRHGDRAPSLGLGAPRQIRDAIPYVGSRTSESRPNSAWPRSARAIKLIATALLGIVKPVDHADGQRPAVRARGEGGWN